MEMEVAHTYKPLCVYVCLCVQVCVCVCVCVHNMIKTCCFDIVETISGPHKELWVQSKN